MQGILGMKSKNKCARCGKVKKIQDGVALVVPMVSKFDHREPCTSSIFTATVENIGFCLSCAKSFSDFCNHWMKRETING